MTAPTPGLCNFVKCITDDGQELPMMRCPNCQKPRMVGYRCDGCDLAAAQSALASERDKLKARWFADDDPKETEYAAEFDAYRREFRRVPV